MYICTRIENFLRLKHLSTILFETTQCRQLKLDGIDDSPLTRNVEDSRCGIVRSR